MSKPIDVNADIGQTYTFFWAFIFIMVIVLGSSIGFFATKHIQQPTFVKLLNDTTSLQTTTEIDAKIQTLESRLDAVEQRIKQLEGNQ